MSFPVFQQTLIIERNQNKHVVVFFRNWASLGVVEKETALHFWTLLCQIWTTDDLIVQYDELVHL